MSCLVPSQETQEEIRKAGPTHCPGELLGWWQWYQGLRSHQVKFGAEDGATGISAASALHNQLCTPAGAARWGKGRKLLLLWEKCPQTIRTSGRTVGAAASRLSFPCPPWWWPGRSRLTLPGAPHQPLSLGWVKGADPIPSTTRSFPGQHPAPGDAISVTLPPCDGPGAPGCWVCLGQDGWEALGVPHPCRAWQQRGHCWGGINI